MTQAQAAELQLDIDSETRAVLERHAFDEALFWRLRRRMLAGELSSEHNRLRETPQLPAPGDLLRLPEPGSAARAACEQRGRAAMRGGEVGCVVLAGGMATRFGGVVKAEVDALPGHSFLSLKLGDIRQAARRAGARVPVYLMSSLATHEALQALCERERCDEMPVEVFSQFIALRLTPEGEIFLGDDGRASPYAPGHGDMSFALRHSGVLARFLSAGGKLLSMSNVDNLGATLEPAVIGAHLGACVEMTVEVVERRQGEPGGAPARIGDKLQIVEDFRFPHGFALDSIPFFNTNTFTLDAAALDRAFELTWFLVRKQVDGREAIQFEHLVGELSVHLSCVGLQVPRDGDTGRFQPVKDPAELELRRPQIETIMRARGVL
jgi:UTP--glucose-1-phosphate uridylyltransferase